MKIFSKALLMTLLASTAIISIPTTIFAITLNSKKEFNEFDTAQTTLHSMAINTTATNTSLDKTQTTAKTTHDGTLTLSLVGNNLPTDTSAYVFTFGATRSINIIKANSNNVVLQYKNNNQIDVNKDLPAINIQIKNNNNVISNEIIANKIQITYTLDKSGNFIQLTNETKKIVGHRNAIGSAAIKVGIPAYFLNLDNEISRFRLGKLAKKTDYWVNQLLIQTNKDSNAAIEFIETK